MALHLNSNDGAGLNSKARVTPTQTGLPGQVPLSTPAFHVIAWVRVKHSRSYT